MSTANALIRGLTSIGIILVAMSKQGALTFFGHEFLPSSIADIMGVAGVVFVFPALWAALFGVIGLPATWFTLLSNSVTLFSDRNFFGRTLGAMGTIYKTLVYLPFECPEWLENVLHPGLVWIWFREKERLEPPPAYQLNEAKVKDEYWIFMNGVATTSDIAKSNVRFLYNIFGRPIHMCHNPTDGILVDLLECMADKIGFFDWWETRPKEELAKAIQKALTDAKNGKYKRIVIIAHSQGTIITSKALQILYNKGLTVDMQRYLEVYNFANCAQQMNFGNYRYMENISNKADTVAWLGVLFPYKHYWKDKTRTSIRIEGVDVTEEKLWGHLLNSHYLIPLVLGGKYRKSRLQGYRNGGRPPESVLLNQLVG